jgi:hypothetical protein
MEPDNTLRETFRLPQLGPKAQQAGEEQRVDGRSNMRKVMRTLRKLTALGHRSRKSLDEIKAMFGPDVKSFQQSEAPLYIGNMEKIARFERTHEAPDQEQGAGKTSVDGSPKARRCLRDLRKLPSLGRKKAWNTPKTMEEIKAMFGTETSSPRFPETARWATSEASKMSHIIASKKPSVRVSFATPMATRRSVADVHDRKAILRDLEPASQAGSSSIAPPERGESSMAAQASENESLPKLRRELAALHRLYNLPKTPEGFSWLISAVNDTFNAEALSQGLQLEDLVGRRTLERWDEI